MTESINLSEGIFITEDGETVPIDGMLDENGERCGMENAVIAVAGPTKAGKWISVVLAEFETVTIN